MTIFIEFFFFSFYICTNTHLFYLIGRLFPVLGGGFVETFGEPVVCVRECVCVFVHTFGQRRGPVMVHGVCSHVLCVTVSSLFPPGFFFFFFICTSDWCITGPPHSNVCIYFFVDLPNAVAKDVSWMISFDRLSLSLSSPVWTCPMERGSFFVLLFLICTSNPSTW